MRLTLLIKTSLVLLVLSLFIYCQSNKPISQKAKASPYAGHNDTVAYVGMQECRLCHSDIYDTYIRTGMGKSFDLATRQKSIATFDQHSLVYDSVGNYHYFPYWKNDSLFIKEFRLSGKDTVHQRDQYVQYIVGSGQHTNSHIYEHNGFLFQAPITYYSQEGRWDLAPGFEGGFSSRFNRLIGNECMNCHNNHPEFVAGSENKFLEVPRGIECERCHGPGEVHVLDKKAGVIVDTSIRVDYSIVNPGRLSRDRQLDLCQRCHMQGITVLKDSMDFADFKPGMQLNKFMEIFLPEYDGGQNNFIMASQAHRMNKSKCFKMSQMTCISCHNPHVSVEDTPLETFNTACKNCHQDSGDKLTCNLDINARMQKKDDCSGCHMPKSGSIDIPHVEITDHFIRIPLSEEEKTGVEEFIGLACTTNASPDPLDVAQAQINFYEQFQADPAVLDSARFYLNQSGNSLRKTEIAIHMAFLQSDYKSIRELAATADRAFEKPWTYYRVGEAELQATNNKEAYALFEEATKRMPLNLDFQNKFGSAAAALNNFEEAKTVFEKIISENAQHVAALSNLGFVSMKLGDSSKAMQLYKQAMQLDPDYAPAKYNLVGLYTFQRKYDKAKQLLRQMLSENPKDQKARDLLSALQASI